MQTPQGGRKQSATIRKKYGDDFWGKISGGHKKNPKKGFGSNPELAKSLAKKAAEARWKKYRESKLKPID